MDLFVQMSAGIELLPGSAGRGSCCKPGAGDVLVEPGGFLRNHLLLPACPSLVLPTAVVCVLLALLRGHSVPWTQPLSLDLLPLLWAPGSAERAGSRSLSLTPPPLIQISSCLLQMSMGQILSCAGYCILWGKCIFLL